MLLKQKSKHRMYTVHVHVFGTDQVHVVYVIVIRMLVQTCRQMMGLTRQPKVVETVWDPRPRGENKAEKEERREVRGRSSLTTTQDLTHVRSMPRVWEGGGEEAMSDKNKSTCTCTSVHVHVND